MPAQSKSQQRFFGVVKAMQKGDIPKKGRAGKIAKQMSKKDVDDFASTKHKGKPEKVKREQRVRELIKKMVREELDETTVRISTMKDVSFAGRDRLQLVGKKGKLGLDRKSVSALVKAVRSALGRSFTTHEQKLNEAKTITLPNGVKAKIEFKGITLQAKGKKPVFLDRTEMMIFFKATQKYMKQGLAAGKMSEGKLSEGKNTKLISNLKNDISKLDKLVKSKKPTDSFLKKDMIVLTKAANKIFDRIETFKYFTEGKLTEGKKVPFDKVKVGTKIQYQMGVVYIVTKVYPGGFLMRMYKSGNNPGMFAPKARIEKDNYESQVKMGFIKLVKEACQKGYKTHPTRKTKEMFGKRYRNCIKAEDKINERMDKRKAAVLLKQLGGNRFIAMTGAKGFAVSNKYMSFKIGRNSKGINFVRIGHNAKDLYDMEFGFVSVRGIKVKKKVKDVYADMLGQMFKKHTGMNVRL